MLYLPTKDHVNCSSDVNFCHRLFNGNISGNYWGVANKNDYAEVFFKRNSFLLSYTLYGQDTEPGCNAKGVVVHGILPNKSMIEIDKITSSYLNGSNARQARTINYKERLSSLRFTVFDTWGTVGTKWFGGILRIDVNIKPYKTECKYKIKSNRSFSLSFIALIFS